MTQCLATGHMEHDVSKRLKRNIVRFKVCVCVQYHAFTKGCYFYYSFASMSGQTLPRRYLLLRKEFALLGANSFLLELTLIKEEDNNETCRVYPFIVIITKTCSLRLHLASHANRSILTSQI